MGYELGHTDYRRAVRNRIRFLTRQDERNHRTQALPMGGELPRKPYAEHGFTCKSRTDHTHRHRLPDMDRHRCGWHRIDRHFLLQRTRHFRAAVLHHHTDNLDNRPENGVTPSFPRLMPGELRIYTTTE